MPALLNFALFQLGWFVGVLGAANGVPWTGALAAGAIVAVHLARAARRVPEIVLLGLAALAGAAWDTALAQTGVVAFAPGASIPGIAPYWIVALWINFATMLNLSLAWLKRRLALAAAAGAVGGPLAYLAGAKLGALELVSPAPAMAALAIGWALLTPLLLLLARRFDGYGTAPAEAPHPEAGHA